MRYCFESKVEKKENGYKIRIPFNVWEVCKQRDVISAEVVLDNHIMNCELLPLEKGSYEVFIKEEDMASVECQVPCKVLLHVTDALDRLGENSPYSFENPIRKIDNIEVILQKQDGLCGQACVAMLAGITIARVAEAVDCNEWQMTMGRMISALNYFGIAHSETIIYTEGRTVTLPKCCILMERMGRFCHYLVYFDGKFYDPNLGVLEEFDVSKLVGYLEIKL